MKICYENEDRIKYIVITGNFRIDNKTTYYYQEGCTECGDPYLRCNNNSRYCSAECANGDENNPMYGKKLSEESKQKIGDAHRNKIVSMPSRLKMSISGKTKIFTEEHRKNISESLIGRRGYYKHSEETKQKLSDRAKERFSDPRNHPNWKGGIKCEPYCFQWTDKEYKRWLMYERDKGKCQNLQCSRKHSKLHLHHINYIKKDCPPANLITLCVSCNSKANYDREWHEAYYTALMKKKGYIR